LSLKMLRRKRSQRFLLHLGAWLYARYGRVLLLLLMLTILAGYFASKLEQKTTVRDLLPTDNQVVARFEQTVAHFDLIDRLVVVVEFDPQDMELAELYAEILVEQVNQHPDHAEYLYWMVADLFRETRDNHWHRYLQYLARLLPADLLPKFEERLTREGMAERIEENRRDLESGLSAKSLIESDPLNLLEFAAGYRKEITGNYQIQFNDGFLVSRSRDMLLILGKPTESPENVEFSVALKSFIEARVEEAKAVFVEEEGVDPDSLFSIGLTGPHPITANENELIRADITNMFATSFIMVMLLFIFAYRRPMAIVYVGIPLICAEIWTLGLGYVLFGRLNLLTAAFSAVIVGLGIDYAIHIFSRYLDERLHGHDPAKAMGVALSETGLGTFIGGFTTALAFLAMGISNFSGLREFSIIASLGIVLCLVAMFILLPCMVFWRESWRRKDKPITRAQWDFHVEKLLSVCLRHKRLTLVILLIGTIYLGYEAIQLRFNSDLRSVRAQSNAAISLQSTVTDKVGGSLRSLTFVLEAPTEAQLYRMHDQLMPVLEELKNEGSLVRADSLLGLLRRPEQQQANLDRLREGGIRTEELVATFEAEVSKQGFRYTPAMQAYIENLAEGLEATEPVTLHQVLEKDAKFVKPFLNFFDGSFHTIVHVYPSTGLWEKNAISELTDHILASVNPEQGTDLFVTGIQTISEELKSLVKQSFEISTLLAGLLIMGAMFFHFRKLSLVIFTLLPLVIALIWMLGTMQLLGISITILNFVATPLIIGIGIDDGVHIVEKYLHRRDQDLHKLIAACGKAVTLTSLTTIFGFSSLFLADYSGFQSLGLCAILGVFYCWLGAVVLLPLLLDLFNVRFVRSNATSTDGSQPAAAETKAT